MQSQTLSITLRQYLLIRSHATQHCQLDHATLMSYLTDILHLRTGLRTSLPLVKAKRRGLNMQISSPISDQLRAWNRESYEHFASCLPGSCLEEEHSKYRRSFAHLVLAQS